MSSPSPSLGTSYPVRSILEGLNPTFNYAWSGLTFFIGLIIYTYLRSKPYDMIPSVGSTGFFSSYRSAIDFFKNAKGMLQEGYDKYNSRVFRYPEITRWHLVVSGDKLTEELRRAPDDVLSFHEATRQSLAVDFTLGPNIANNQYHIGIVRGPLTRNIGNIFPDVRDETVLAFDDNIPITSDWTRIKAFDTVMNIVSRTSNRVFIGAPACRDPEYNALAIKFTIDVIVGAKIINMFPSFLKPVVGHLFTNVPKAVRTGMKHLTPIIEERKKKIEEYGPYYPDKPNDALSWLMDEAVGEECTARNLTLRILSLNFAAIHTSSMSLTHTLYHLAARPEYVEPLRKEIEAVVAEDGWTKAAMTRMRKLDSFLKEVLRIHGLGALSMTRKALTDFTFSDGTHIPKGATISAISSARHLDDNVYPNGRTFDGFRFSTMREAEGQGTKNHMVATNLDYIPFGHGRHACPGRFFAAHELKALVGHVLLTYDMKMENEGIEPEEEWFGSACSPNRHAEILFRKRRV